MPPVRAVALLVFAILFTPARCLEPWPSLSSDLLLALPIAIHGNVSQHMLLIRRQDKLQDAVMRVCSKWSNVESCTRQVLQAVKPNLEAAILQRTREVVRVVNFTLPDRMVGVAIREGDHAKLLAQGFGAAHGLSVQQLMELDALLTSEWPAVPAVGSGVPQPVTVDPEEVALLAAIGVAIAPADQAEAWNRLGEWLYNYGLSLIHISEPTRLLSISYAVFCLKKKKTKDINKNRTKKNLKKINKIKYINNNMI
eukprot:TRINITY_DN37365_c0_g1_i1.p1 TRINITY_DN37365_c0_g1~~TRINITY_DN37365_c0_g1_i1.p1  ORF type:complete len:254 (+),score=56.07 TRINITY_DN37365_c0_g1_i1:223-984(+)